MEEGSIFQRMKNIFSEEEEMDEILTQEAKGLIKNIFRYMSKDAKDIMTHRKNIVAIDEDTPLSEGLRFMLDENYSRFPVYRESIDEIVGIIHLREGMKCYLNPEKKELPLKDLGECLRDVSFIPETKSIDSIFKEMQNEKNHIAIVLDEYGQTSGLVAMEDILEEIVGNILDEHDDEEETVAKQLDGSLIVDGLMDLEEVEEILPLHFEKEEYGTLNGFIIDLLDRIPTEGEECEVFYQGYRFKVLSIENNTIDRVKIEKAMEE
ncbi:CBS domain containing-hemolysin-like protein [Aequitasia blattaphilus]|uniref:Hemolysin family protein n=1 Tax=Aequitasia blattaphilus TaxID=2949332 RepID=A0ABT1E7I1_9FIRM|nr:hemolysin family protein [Aequitasia blattaphilus]MCP1101666.1 hemolysin family protein [Aequitasia blattaphilus]MCR8614306.1 hemolysin family protein [Aequitasia blattaphilus]